MSLQTLVSVLQGVLIMAIAVLVARLKERPPVFWGIMSLFFGIYALFVLVLLSNAGKSEKNKQSSTPNTIPTVPESHEAESLKTETSTSPAVDSKQPTIDQLSLADWFYVGEKKAVVGPRTLKEMQGLVTDKVVTSDTWVWCEFFPAWKKVNAVAEIVNLFGIK